MKTYVVTLISDDGQKFQLDVGAKSDQEAIDFALSKVEKLNWQIYGYKLYQLERIT